MDGYLKKHWGKKDMLNLGIRHLAICLFSLFVHQSCTNKNEILIKDPVQRIEPEKYKEIYSNACDSLLFWCRNNFENYSLRFNQIYTLDSLLCFNKDNDRFVGVIHRFKNEKNWSDELLILYGERIENKWFFFDGGFITLPRTMYKESDLTPLTYKQMHQASLKEIFSTYLTRNREINNSWFLEQFEGNQWGSIEEQEYLDWCFKGKRFTNKDEFYRAAHLCKVKANWLRRDTTQPINQLPVN
jgi:hypothetical protein